MAVIEKHLHDHFASLQEDDISSVRSSGDASLLADHSAPRPPEPFAKVNSVVPGSPAETAGLKPGDEISSFGYVNLSNHDNLTKVGECVQGNEGVSWTYPLIVILDKPED